MDRQKFDTWLEGYRDAWQNNDRDQVAALFAEDARYCTSPFDEPWVGREAIVDSWTEETGEDEQFELRWEILGVEGDRGIVRCWITYWDAERSEPQEEFSTIWLVELDGEGRCREFTEWYMERPKLPL
ncbi:MAG: nuclear transport factor 2 family protein [Chloroflexi bacterium]|nr:nuclear transport factor 2 family protein [Chloroflexota bacterium]